ncbi:hypothetical protein ACQ4PT_029612 [Festuca glaucescens]
MSSPAWIWNVSYSAVEDLDNGVRNVLDGELHIWPAKRWIVLVDVEGSPIIGKFMRKDDEVLEVGSVVEFSVFHALVDHCILSPPEPQSGMVKVQMNDIAKTLDLASLVRSWKITYSTTKDLDRGRMKAYDGSLCYCMDKYLRLFNAKSALIGCQKVSSSDLFHVGAKIRFTGYVVRMGKLIKSNPAVDDISVKDTAPGDESDGLNKDKAVVNPLETLLAQGSANQSDQATPTSSSFVHAALFKDLDFSHGINFAKDVKNKFNKEVHPSSSSGHFIMVVAFGRANFKLEEDLVGIALEAAIGGFCGQLKVSLLQDRVFSFAVSSKEVGFHILKLKKFSCSHFKCYFYLWGRGGPNWTWEFQRWQRDMEEEWTLVSPSKRIMQHGFASLKKEMPKPILNHKNRANKKLVFAKNLGYEACLGYQSTVKPAAEAEVHPATLVTSSAPHISYSTAKPFPCVQKNLDDDVNVQLLILGESKESQAETSKAVEEEFENYRNDFDIAQAVATFVGGAKESWTAPVYILTAEFAEALPADEDQMPPDGNPHPFPGELQPNNNIFVNPQFPEIGWDAVQDFGHEHKHVPKACLSAPFAFLKKLFGAGSVLELQRGGKHLECFIDTSMLQVSLPVGDSERRVEVADLQGGLQQEAPISSPKKRRTKATAPLVQSADRRFTRSCLKMDGYRPTPVLAVQPKIKKKVRAKNLLMTMEHEAVEQPQEEEQRNGEQAAPVPPIPLALLQRVGHSLGIAPDRLSKEQLEAAPDDKQDKESPHE